METRKMICVVCPKGCVLTASIDENNHVSVQGNGCKRGEAYATDEWFDARRMLTTTMPVEGRPLMLSVRTAEAIPKKLLFPAMEVIRRAKAAPPVQVGDVMIQNLLDTGVDVIATNAMK